MTLLDEYFKDTVERDFFNMQCPELLGSGMSREVWAVGFDNKYVIKFERGRVFQNIKEWELWNEISATKQGKWLAPCINISENGRVLIMQRTKPAKTEAYPEKMPEFLTDFKYKNYGMFGKQLVCHDYGTNLSSTWGACSGRTKKANWYHE